MAAKFSPAGALAGLLRRFSEAARRYRVEWWILVAGCIVVRAILFMTVPPSLHSFQPHRPERRPADEGSERDALMGTDNLGRDVWARVVYGSRTILGVAIAASLLSAFIGIPLGLMSGFSGQIGDKVLSLIMDSIYSFPGLILAIAFAAMLGPGVINITVAVAVIYVPTYFRLVRGQTLSIKQDSMSRPRTPSAPAGPRCLRNTFSRT